MRLQLVSKNSLVAAMLVLAVMLLQPNLSYAKTNKYGLPDFTELAEQNNKVVVNISTIQKKSDKKRQQMPEQFKGMPEELLRHFFGIPPEMFQQQPDGRQGNKPQVSSLGSGFIISEDGYILTNNHVVEDADEIIVRMRDRKELKAELIGTDPRTDVALIKINATGLPFAKIGTSKDLKVGQWALAIGEPFGLDYTVTHGIISALGRSLPEDTYVPFIQTDVPINPGNSGGPLFNLDGEVVGINSQIYSKSGGSMGLSFSIPIDIAMNVAEQLKKNGKVVRGFLGVQIQEVTSDLSESFGLEKPTGALVGEVYDNTPAKEYGIQAGDVILEFDGKPIAKSSDLPPVVGMTPINKKVKVKLIRQGEIKYITVKLTSLDKSKDLAMSSNDGLLNSNQLGATIEDLDPEWLKSKGLPYGVRVTDVFSGPAEQAGVRTGDVIVTIDFKPVKSVREFNELMKSLPKKRSLPVRVIRDGRSVFLPLVLD
ncbi:DegQ family serine endoprotease [Thiomicrorhabdus sp. 6S2-11]|uniref:Probable periplasmic serine endoprotease DegP-like n=1 Tax=Thiomicrorhabdus marina TaxID=2818442 RepID=A0ABS3Q378_9GAMM|nr:DegQ family serine endoprotease [Thiomicrorhabdus marina]MBO1926786.1 DegQ family serine endoprotease [Thiomicrorhabdus marina]